MSIAPPLGLNRPLMPALSSIKPGRIAAVEVFEGLSQAEPVWRAMLRGGAVTTPYQQFDFAALWHRHVGQRAEVVPFIVTAWDAIGEPILVLPLGLVNYGPVRALTFLGGKYANLNFGLWACDFAASATEAEVTALIASIAQRRPRVDLIALHRQPRHWNGVANPLSLLPHQPSPSDSRRLELLPTAPGQIGGQLHGATRKQLRSKDRRLAGLPGYRYRQVTTAADAERLLDWFFPVKARHLAAQGCANVFAEPGVLHFIREACRIGLASDDPSVELHALECDSEILAVIGGIGDGRHFSSIFNTYTTSEHSRQSPGLVLLMRLLDNLAERGYRSFDLGVGDARYKRMICRTVEPLFDTFLPLTFKGQLAATAARAYYLAKRGIKQQPALWSVARMLRRIF